MSPDYTLYGRTVAAPDRSWLKITQLNVAKDSPLILWRSHIFLHLTRDIRNSDRGRRGERTGSQIRSHVTRSAQRALRAGRDPDRRGSYYVLSYAWAADSLVRSTGSFGESMPRSTVTSATRTVERWKTKFRKGFADVQAAHVKAGLGYV
jgi:hypothetical protein